MMAEIKIVTIIVNIKIRFRPCERTAWQQKSMLHFRKQHLHAHIVFYVVLNSSSYQLMSVSDRAREHITQTLTVLNIWRRPLALLPVYSSK